MRRTLQILTVAGVLCVAPCPSSAQQPAPCTYDECGIRIRSSFWSTSFVQGADEKRVAGLGFFAPQMSLFQERSDSAGVYYAAFRSRHNTGAALSLVTLGVLIAGAVTASKDADLGAGLLTVVIPLTFITGGVRASAADRLSRAVWWYNRELTR